MNLPTELHIKIVKELPWQDVLQVRETCKTLREATQTWEIWAHLVNEHISSKLDPPRLERPIERYSSRELEDLFLRWKGTEIAWATDGGFPTRERTFISTTGAPRHSHLVKGGRWYLTTAHRTAEVTYYDLEAETIVGVQLIPPQAYNCRLEQDLAVALEVHTETQYFEFTMAFSIFDWRSDDETDGVDDGLSSDNVRRHKAIHIWRIVCILDDSGRAIGLSATQLATIPNRVSFLGVFSLSLRGPVISMAVYDNVQREWLIIVVEWERGHGQELYPMRIIDRCNKTASLYLLPNSQLLCHRESKFLLYDYSAVQETTTVSKAGINRKFVLVWSLPARGTLRDTCIAVSCIGNTTKVLFRELRFSALFSLSFDHGSRKPPPLVRVMNFPGLCDFYAVALGTNRSSVFLKSTRIFQLITYTPTVEGLAVAPPPSVSRSAGPLSFLPAEFPDHSIDEDIGRVVIPATSYEPAEAFVVDFSKYI